MNTHAVHPQGVPFYDHFALDVPSEVLEFGLDVAGVDPVFGVYDLFWRVGEPVDWTTTPPTADGQVEIAQSPFSFRADGQTTPLVPGESWYFGLRWRGDPGSGALELTAVASQEPQEDSDLEGCACGAAVAPGGRGGVAVWLLALVGVLRRRSVPTSARGGRRLRD